MVFFVTLICCIMGMYNKNPFTFAMNVITPVVLTALGIIMLKLAAVSYTHLRAHET